MGAVPRGNVLARFTLRSLAASRVRTAVTVAGVALATGLLMAVLASVTSLRQGLIDRTRSLDGVFQAAFEYTEPKKVDDLRGIMGERLDRLALERDLGAAPLSAEDGETSGAFLGVLSIPEEQPGTAHAAGDDAFSVLAMPEASEGRLPERAGEICLPSYLRGATLTPGPSALPGVDSSVAVEGGGPLQVGSRVTLALGRRTYADDPGSIVRSGASLTDGEAFGDVGAPRTYTVVGFFDASFRTGLVALVCPEEPVATASGTDAGMAYLSTTGYASEEEIGAALAAAGIDSFQANQTLLMYQGIDTSRAAFDSIQMMGATLAVVIMVAAVSLISNAFTISLSERTRQFGLLSSLGASRRQLRRTVLVEAGVIGLAGIPLGVALGVAGASAAFALTAEGWSSMVGADVRVGLVLRPADLALAVVLSALTLLASVWAPAVRAGRVSAIDAIRGARDIRPSRRLARTFRRRRAAADDLSADLRRPRGLAARLGGMPAFLARRTLAVSAGKSRVAVASLAVSVALLVTAGLIGDYLRSSLSYIDTGTAGIELTVNPDGPDARPGEDVERMNELVADLSEASGAERVSALGTGTATLHLDPAALSQDARATYAERSNFPPYATRDGYANGVVHVVDDETWRALARDLGLDAQKADPAHLSCVVWNAINVNDSNTYGTVAPLDPSVGSVRLVVPPAAGDDAATGEKYRWVGLSYDEDATLGVWESDPKTGESTLVADGRTAGLDEVEVDVAAVTESLGDSLAVGARPLIASNAVTVVMPQRALSASPASAAVNGLAARYYVVLEPGADDERTLEELEGIVEATDGLSLGTYTNLAELVRENRSMTHTVTVFLYCFTAITMAIAVANVFNTIASGLMLRTREFAVLQSAGMGRRAFRRMIVLECGDVALKGLAAGIVLSALVNASLFRAMSQSIATLSLAMPWGHVSLACAMAGAVLAVSAVYALRQTHAMDLVEALRAETL